MNKYCNIPILIIGFIWATVNAIMLHFNYNSFLMDLILYVPLAYYIGRDCNSIINVVEFVLLVVGISIVLGFILHFFVGLISLDNIVIIFLYIFSVVISMVYKEVLGG